MACLLEQDGCADSLSVRLFAPLRKCASIFPRKRRIAMCHVLIIEDEWLLAMDAGDLARKGGATSVVYASSEEAAIAAARTLKPDVIISDVRLRKGTGPGAIRS